MMTSKRYKVSATSFYNVAKCERRVYMDEYGDPEDRQPYSDFLRLLWERGVRIENEIVDQIKKDREVAVVEGLPGDSTFEMTLALMRKGVPLIYQGVLIHQDKIGRPDLLEKVEGSSDLGNYHYIPCDIKSGRATENKESPDIKSHYANQVSFYAELLGLIQGKKPEVGKIIDVAGEETEFRIAEYADGFNRSRDVINGIVYDGIEPEPIIGGVCKDCVWTEPCRRWAEAREDLSLLFYLGKQKHALKDRGIHTIKDLSTIDIGAFLKPPLKIKGVAAKKLGQWKSRAHVRLTKQPVIYSPPNLRSAKREIYYDIEDDPSQDHVYLHGFIEVIDGKQSDYKYILAPKREQEKEAAEELWSYIESISEDDVIYHYASHEYTKIKLLMEKYSLPVSAVEKFNRLRVDLYGTVLGCSDWPLTSYGVKSIAKFLGFNWTAEDASGANSIAWYSEYSEDPENQKDMLQKILTYNKEDCIAMIVVKEFMEKTPVQHTNA